MTIEKELCNSLCAILRDGIDIHRCLAAQALGRLRPEQPEAAVSLTDALLDQDEDVRTDAAGALAVLADPASGPQLLENLIGDPCAEVKRAALDALVRMRHPDIVPWLRRLVRERDPEVVWDEDGFHSEGWDDWTDIQAGALAGLARLGAGDAVADITAAIDDEFGQDLTEAGFSALAGLGAPGIAALTGYLESGDTRCRRRVAAVLGATASAAASGAVDRALEDPAPEVRLAAAGALAGRDPADGRLKNLFRDHTAQVRAAAVALCGHAHPDQVHGLLDDGAAPVRRAVLDLLAGTPDLLPAAAVGEWLRVALAADDGATAAAAAAALAAVAPSAAVDDLCAVVLDTARPGSARAGAAKALARIGGEAAEKTLAAVVGDDDRALRLAAMTGLLAMARARSDWPNPPGDALLSALAGELVPAPEPAPETAPETAPESDDEPGPEPAPAAAPTSTLEAILGGDTPPPGATTDDGNPVVLTQRDLDLLALAERMPRKQRVPLTPKLAPHEDVRRIAARLLGDLARDEVAAALADVLDDGDAEVAVAAADSLARIGDAMASFAPEVTAHLKAALARTRQDIRLCAIRALGAAGGNGTAGVLSKLLTDDDSFIRAEAVRAVSGLHGADGRIAALLSDPDRAVRTAAAEAVAATGGADAVEQLVGFALSFGGEHRCEAGRLLRGVDAPAASARFIALLDDPGQVKNRPVAIEALVELNRPHNPL